jgi:hypothetical protein
MQANVFKFKQLEQHKKQTYGIWSNRQTSAMNKKEY